ncbi:hypothetical protein L596_029465 [Steinernema carpocapsae]|uniref:Uncharacterized protein n=1 Tax=Steinernema carpocapsae TaxID=34508 RepID=A0A4U5LUR1_STECR|nr:hypothetical protein L596_029465 [Steinernema carpocapsae]
MSKNGDYGDRKGEERVTDHLRLFSLLFCCQGPPHSLAASDSAASSRFCTEEHIGRGGSVLCALARRRRR